MAIEYSIGGKDFYGGAGCRRGLAIRILSVCPQLRTTKNISDDTQTRQYSITDLISLHKTNQFS